MAFSSNKYPSNRTGAPSSSSGAPSMFTLGAAGTNQHRGYYQHENKEVDFDPDGAAGGAAAGGVGGIRRGGGGESYRYNKTHSSSTSFGEPAAYRFQHGGGSSSRRHAMDERPQHYDYNNHQAPYSAPHGNLHSNHHGRRYEPSSNNGYYQHRQYDQQHQHLQQHHQQDHLHHQQESAGHYNHNYRQAEQRYDYFSSHNKAPPPPPQSSSGPPPQSSKYYHTTLPDVPTLVESDASDLEDSDGPKYMGSWGGQRSATRGGPKPPPSTAVTHAKKPPPTPTPPSPRRPSSFHDTGDEVPNLHEKVATLKYVEVAPGVHVRLRGADETWRSIESDFYMPTQCLPCGLTIFCIQDADFVICPDCRVVSPMMMVMEGGKECSNYCEGKSDGGVGLGFTMEDLAAWQEDIERQRRIIPR